MSVFRLEYPLVDGYIHNWLLSGPQAIPVPDLARFAGDDFKLQMARHYYREDSGVDQTPVERGTWVLDGTELAWAYRKCLDDHWVDLSTFYHTRHYLRAWAYAQLASPAAQEVTFVMTTNGPADLWINGHHVHRQEHFFHQDPHSVSFRGKVEKGQNEILVRFEEVAVRECPYVMALQVQGLPAGEAAVLLPTGNEYVVRRQMLERVFDQAYLEGQVHYKGDHIILRWPEDLEARFRYACQIQDAQDRIYVEALPEAQPSRVLNIGHPARLWERHYDVVLRPRPEEYYDRDLRYERRMPIHVLDHPYSEVLYGTYGERRSEALQDAARREGNLYAEIAKLELERWTDLDVDVITGAIDGVDQRRDCSDFDLVGLLGLMYRYAHLADFPLALKQPLEACVLGFKYWLDEPGTDAMCYDTENHSILFHSCEILAGQLYPDRVFTNAGQTGQWHREKGEHLALEWLHQRGANGFSEWDSNCYFEEDLLALSHLFDLAENQQVQELAAVVMDKMLFTMALNSFKGVFGSTHGRTYAPMIEGGWLEATSGITRLMWGMGVWNHHVRGTVGIACSEYELPPIIAEVATDLSREVWDREQHQGVNKVTYRTADYMLCSVQDYRPGEKGYQQHVWQATMGPEAVVFVTHPPCSSAEGAHRPNFWAGNYLLPRVAQWKDTLVAVHQLADDDWLGFTHAYWPAYAFDEYRLRDGWAFARKGRAYLALNAAQGLELIRRGPGAYRELRSHGRENVWLCMLGRPDSDGSFEDFQKKVRSLDVDLQPSSVECSTLRGERLAFGWEGPLLVNGEEQQLAGFKHYECPYCTVDLPATEMELRTENFLLRLHFA